MALAARSKACAPPQRPPKNAGASHDSTGTNPPSCHFGDIAPPRSTQRRRRRHRTGAARRIPGVRAGRRGRCGRLAWRGRAFLRRRARAATPEARADTLDFKADSATPPGPMGPSRLQLSKPVIAAISGAAVAGGMELALWCDLRVMEEDAYFGIFCRRFGVPLIDGGPVRLPRLIGLSQALDLILTGRKVESAEALRIGLCNRVVPSGQALEAALALAQELAAFPQATLRADRASALAAQGLPVPQALLQEWAIGRHCLAQALHGASVASPIRCRRLRAAIGAQRKAHRAANTERIGKRCNAAMRFDGQRRPTDEHKNHTNHTN